MATTPAAAEISHAGSFGPSRAACAPHGFARWSGPKPVLVAIVITGWVLCDTVPTAAQTSSLFSGSQGRSSGTAAGSSLGGVTGGLGGTGRTGGGATGGRAATTQLNTQAGTSASVDTTFSGGFVGRSDNLGRFVGRQEAGTQRASGSTNFGAFQFGAFSNAFRSQFQPGAGTPGSSDPRTRIRVQQRLAFEVPARPQSSVTAGLRQRLSLIVARRPQLAGVQFELRPDGRVRLTGRAPDEHQKRLAELLVRMEPGVSGVINEITIAQ